MDDQPGNTTLDVFTVLSHVTLGVLAAIVIEHSTHYDRLVQAGFVILYLTAVLLFYRWIKRKMRQQREGFIERKLKELKREAEKLTRYQFLQSHTLEIVGEFLKDRYRANHAFSVKVRERMSQHTMNVEALNSLLDEFDGKRREHIKSALQKIASYMPAGDLFRKPNNIDDVHKDHLKISFYAVEDDPDVAGTKCLLKKWRFYPNEGEPRTRRFTLNQGAAGTAWARKRIVVCENGGDDPIFTDMWDGGGQAKEYASMICVPAIEDIPTEKIGEVYGVLTIDTPIRRGYFQGHLEQFWADLFQPICNMLVYCHESEIKKEALTEVISSLCNSPQATSPTP